MDPWSKGDYSRHIPEAIMVMERPPEVNPPSDRVPRQLLLAILRSESRRRRNSGRNRVTGLLLRVFGARGKYRPKGSLRGAPGPCGQVARPPLWPCHQGAWIGGGPPRGPLRAYRVICLAYFLYNFFGIFRALLFLTFSCNAWTIADRNWHWALS